MRSPADTPPTTGPDSAAWPSAWPASAPPSPCHAALCYVPRRVRYKLCRDPAAGGSGRSLLSVSESPGRARGSKKLAKVAVELRKGTCVQATGEEYCNSQGLWVKLSQVPDGAGQTEMDRHGETGGHRWTWREMGRDTPWRHRWIQGRRVDRHAEGPTRPWAINPACAGRFVPPTWSYECDEDLVHFLYDHLGKEDENLGSVKQYVESIDVSSYTEDFNVSCLTDGNADTYWESDGSQGQHWVRLTMKKGTIVKKLLLTVDTTDENFMPRRIMVYGGEGDNLKKLSDVGIDESYIGDVCVLEDMTTHLPIIEIRIVECRDDGIDVRLRGIKIKSSRQRELGLRTDPDLLYRRAMLIQRFIKLLDSVLHHLVPAWDHTVGTFSWLKHIKQFLLLSKRRTALIAQCLKDSETSKPNFMPRLYINRRLAMEHRDNPALDPSCKNAVFTQVHEGLKPSDKYEKPLDYRWPLRYDQWWECKFIAEGIIDQGGGFRDSLADMSEELCPSSAESPVPLPFFVRTSNQGNGTGEARDMYVPNPACKEFAKYEWIGQIMGAALRGKEFLVLALPGFVWKQLTGEEVSWSKDFPAVDSVLVKLLEVMEVMDKETFEFKFGQELTYTTVLSDQRMVELIPNGGRTVVRYEDRKEFIRLVQKARLEESKEQIAAMQAGLLKVVPQAVLDLLTWQELEKKVCGDPEVTVDALKKLTRFEDLLPSDTRVQYFWEALRNFTNEDRSRFLRFVTGRSRLPARIYIYPDKLGSETTDALPESSTCSSSLYLPNYATAKVCEEKLRYAAYNCVAIDMDMSPWEE
uniref:HECT domain E3 ubiquitin protein ligase 3 n=1 Tax=Chelonoidis abingdonii TaxID=106734 RepID=A0A8C0IM63_CHEAB